MNIVFATHNLHKLEEIRALLQDHHHILGLSDMEFTREIPEEHETLEENASQKAWFVKQATGHNCFADDTGLEVECLGGAPGVYSARFSRMGELQFPDMEAAAGNIRKLLQLMEGERDRKACFRTVISLVLDDREYQFEGRVDGEILSSASGARGFGYDPVFRPLGYDLTFAEMDLQEKNLISHRARAVQKLTHFLNEM